MSEDGTPEGFVDGDALLKELMGEPGMRHAVDIIHASNAQANRIYAEGLAQIRKLAELTQVELAEKMGVQQAAVSRIESRSDLLLSTLAQYALASGASNGRLVFEINGLEIELALDNFAHSL